jgi:hypoxanthine phosphoribosyltransferase
MVQEVVEAKRKQTGIDHKLYIFAKSSDDPNSRDGGFDGHVQDYVPVTAPDEARYLALSPQQKKDIKQMFEDGAMVVALDDIFSTGATLEAIDKLLKQIGVIVAKRFAVGEEKLAKLVEFDGDQLVWEVNDDDDEQKLEVETAFILPLFEGEDVQKIIERRK